MISVLLWESEIRFPLFSTIWTSFHISDFVLVMNWLKMKETHKCNRTVCRFMDRFQTRLWQYVESKWLQSEVKSSWNYFVSSLSFSATYYFILLITTTKNYILDNQILFIIRNLWKSDSGTISFSRQSCWSHNPFIFLEQHQIIYWSMLGLGHISILVWCTATLQNSYKFFHSFAVSLN